MNTTPTRLPVRQRARSLLRALRAALEAMYWDMRIKAAENDLRNLEDQAVILPAQMELHRQCIEVWRVQKASAELDRRLA